MLNEDYIQEAYESVTMDPQQTTAWLGRERWMDVSIEISL